MDAVNKNPRENLIIWVSFLFLTITWGSSFILVKKSLIAFPPLIVASLRLSSAMLVVLPFSIGHFKHIPRDKFKYVVLIAFLGMGLPAFLFALAQVGINSSMSGILNALTPCMTFLIGILFFKQKSSALKIFGLVLGFIGSASLIFFNTKGELHLNGYSLFVILATIMYGTNLNTTKRFAAGIKPIHLSTVSISIAGLFGLIVLLSTNFVEILKTNPKAPFSLLTALTLGIVGTAISQTLFNNLLSKTSAFFASSITYFIPLMALVWGILDGESLSIWHYFGMLLLIGGIIVINKFK